MLVGLFHCCHSLLAPELNRIDRQKKEFSEYDIPADAEIEVIEESYLNAPFADEPADTGDRPKLDIDDVSEIEPDEDSDLDEVAEYVPGEHEVSRSAILRFLGKPENAIIANWIVNFLNM